MTTDHPSRTTQGAPDAASPPHAHPPVDRSGWPSGPWDGEPDRVDFKTKAGLPGLITRVRDSGHLCGYVAVPPGHPLHGKSYEAIDAEIEVHGGLTYSDKCTGHICHVPDPGEPDDVWWFGFDAAHSFDVRPGLLAMLPRRFFASSSLGEDYRTVRYMRAECERLAEQLAGLA